MLVRNVEPNLWWLRRFETVLAALARMELDPELQAAKKSLIAHVETSLSEAFVRYKTVFPPTGDEAAMQLAMQVYLRICHHEEPELALTDLFLRSSALVLDAVLTDYDSLESIPASLHHVRALSCAMRSLESELVEDDQIYRFMLPESPLVRMRTASCTRTHACT